MKWKIGKSKIHGNGVFATQDIQLHEDLGVSIPLVSETKDAILWQRNTFGLMINHSNENPNTKVHKQGKDWHFVAILPIKDGEELTTDYQDYLDKIDLESIISRKRVSVI